MFRHRRQRGQSLVETAVLAAAVVPLFLAVPLLAKYQDLGRAAIAASRSAAFECSVRPEDCAGATPPGFADDLRRRHFGRHDRDLLSNDAMMNDQVAESSNRFWVDRRGQSLLASFADASVDVAAGDSDAIRGAWLRGAGSGAVMPAGVLGMAGAAAPGAFGLALEKGLVTAGVGAGVSLNRTLAQWLERPEGMALTLTGRTAVLVDSWNASSAKGGEATSFQARVERGWRLPGLGQAAAAVFAEAGRSAPAGELGETRGAGAEEIIDGLYSPIRSLITSPLMAPVEPRGSLFRYHEIDVDIVPEDRLETAP
jgi:hypothetical protein